MNRSNTKKDWMILLLLGKVKIYVIEKNLTRKSKKFIFKKTYPKVIPKRKKQVISKRKSSRYYFFGKISKIVKLVKLVLVKISNSIVIVLASPCLFEILPTLKFSACSKLIFGMQFFSGNYVNWTYIRSTTERPGLLLNVLCIFNLLPVSREEGLSILLPLNILRTPFCCFHCWLFRSKFRLEILSIFYRSLVHWINSFAKSVFNCNYIFITLSVVIVISHEIITVSLVNISLSFLHFLQLCDLFHFQIISIILSTNYNS